MYQYSSLTEQDTLAVRDDGRLLVISYDSIMNYHGGAMPAGVALAFRMFTGLTARYYTLFGDVPERKRVSFYTGLGENGQGIIDTAEALYRVRSGGRLDVDLEACSEKQAPAAPGGGKYYFSGSMGEMHWEARVRDGIIGDEFYAVSRKMHLLHDAGRIPSEKDQKDLMDIRKKTEQQLLQLTPDDLFLFRISAD